MTIAEMYINCSCFKFQSCQQSPILSPTAMMPTQLANQDNHVNDVRVKTVYSGDVMITYINHSITFEEFTQEMVAICRFLPDQVYMATLWQFFIFFTKRKDKLKNGCITHRPLCIVTNRGIPIEVFHDL